ncbi:hypothetical protein L2747_04155 [Shewanella marinintestina]|uniref:hypothetical protein n=1 Tax=Shewanella marinintestina TaxID=190305 RepID=UPI0020102E8F|nr:hypothetical protein [Shewanella marinintestina]MCL1145208.1 hypothetical protein [Shewanella marinintestina]
MDIKDSFGLFCFNDFEEKQQKCSDFSSLRENACKHLVLPKLILKKEWDSSLLLNKLEAIDFKKLEAICKSKCSQSQFYIEPTQAVVMCLIFNEIEDELRRFVTTFRSIEPRETLSLAFNNLDDGSGKYHFYSTALLNRSINSSYKASKLGLFCDNALIKRHGSLTTRLAIFALLTTVTRLQYGLWRNLYTKDPVEANKYVINPYQYLEQIRLHVSSIVESYLECLAGDTTIHWKMTGINRGHFDAAIKNKSFKDIKF